MSSKPQYFYLDNSVYGKFKNDHTKYNNFRDYVNVNDNTNINLNEINLVTTPFFIYEILGVKGSVKMPPIDRNKVNELECLFEQSCLSNEDEKYLEKLSSIIIKLYKDYETKLQGSKFLNMDYLLEQANKATTHSIKPFKEFILKEICPNLTTEFFELFKHNIIIDRLLGHRWSAKLKLHVDAELLRCTVYYLQQGYNVAFTKLVKSFFIGIKNELKEELLSKNPGITTNNVDRLFEKVEKSLSLKASSDLVDTEIIHFATIGWNTSNDFLGVECFTCDNYEDLKWRVIMYKTIIDYGCDIVTNGPQFASCDIHILDENLHGSKILKMDQIKPLYESLIDELQT